MTQVLLNYYDEFSCSAAITPIRDERDPHGKSV